jgi:hypothetical protein
MPILQRLRCPDDPKLMLEQRLCVSPLSKDLEGEIGRPEPERRQCDDPQCLTLTTLQPLRLAVRPSRQGCDQDPAALQGGLEVTDLVHVFDGDANQRGFHSGDVRWASGSTLVLGRLSGITNAGTHRDPVLACQECKAGGFLQGRLCASIVRAEDQRLRGCQVFANYLLHAPDLAGDGIPAQRVTGTLEGVLVCGCGCCG